MKLISLYSSLLLFPLLILFSVGCEGIVDDFGEMSKFRDSLQKVYPEEEINIKISNGTYLGVSFINSDLKKLKKEEKIKIAKNIGQISRYFFKKERILKGNLTFVIYNNYVVFKYSESIDTYNLFISDDIDENSDN